MVKVFTWAEFREGIKNRSDYEKMLWKGLFICQGFSYALCSQCEELFAIVSALQFDGICPSCEGALIVHGSVRPV